MSILQNKGVTSDGKFVRYFTTRNDLIKGNGTLSGYGKYVEVKDGDAIFVKFDGSVSTIKSPEGKLKITFKGPYSYTKGTGKYENIQGGGTFSGGYIGEGILITLTLWVNTSLKSEEQAWGDAQPKNTFC